MFIMRKTLFFSIGFLFMTISGMMAQVEIAVNHTTEGNMAAEQASAGATSATTVTKLTVPGTANLNLNDPPLTSIEGTLANGIYTGPHSFSDVLLSRISVHIPVEETLAYNVVPWKEMNDGEAGADPVNPRIFNTVYDGKNRQYLVYKPVNNFNRNPDGLIVTCHSFNGSMNSVYQSYGLKQTADLLNLIMISPQALPEQDPALINKGKDIGYDLSAVWGAGLYVNAKAYGLVTVLDDEINKDVDDVGFIRSLIQNISIQDSVDTRNVFIAGSSMGGYMAYQYALHHGDELAGLINVVGTMGLHADTANVSFTIPILDFHSTTDETVFYTGSGIYGGAASVTMANGIPVPEILNYWAKRNNANLTPVITNLGTNPTNGVSFKKYDYDHPKNEITHFQLTGAPHSYTISTDNGDPISPSTEIEAFLQRHMTTGSLSANTLIKQKPSLELYPTVTDDVLYLKGINTSSSVSIYNTTGQQIETIDLSNNNQQKISVSHLSKGLYLLSTGKEILKFIKK